MREGEDGRKKLQILNRLRNNIDTTTTTTTTTTLRRFCYWRFGDNQIHKAVFTITHTTLHHVRRFNVKHSLYCTKKISSVCPLLDLFRALTFMFFVQEIPAHWLWPFSDGIFCDNSHKAHGTTVSSTEKKNVKRYTFIMKTVLCPRIYDAHKTHSNERNTCGKRETRDNWRYMIIKHLNNRWGK